MRLSNDIWDRSRFCQGSNSEKKKWNWPYPLNLFVHFDKILHTHYYWHDLDRGIAKSSPRDCKMTFNIGRGYAQLQILKKWKWPNRVDYCDETLHTHWYWQDVAQEIVKCHLGLAEALPRFKFLKKQWNWPYLFKLHGAKSASSSTNVKPRGRCEGMPTHPSCIVWQCRYSHAIHNRFRFTSIRPYFL